MKAIYNLLLIVTLFVLSESCKKSDAGGGTVNPPTTQTDIAAVDAKIATLMSSYNIPGASPAITKNGKLVCFNMYFPII